MKKALALCAFALVMALPMVSSASSITNDFKTSSTGTNALNGIGDTIQFEVSIQLNLDQAYTTVLWTLSGDILTAETETLPFPNTQNIVTNWEWNYFAGTGRVKMGTNGRIFVQDFAASLPPGGPVSAFYGFVENKTGDGVASLVGTVTIQVTALGEYQGGGYLQPGGGLFGTATVADNVVINGGAFTVVPEPGTALLMMLGLGGLGVMGRSNRK